jgi:hypothetical protein
MYRGDLDEVAKRYAAGEIPSDLNPDGYSPLYEAVNDGYVGLVSFLLAKGYGKNLSAQAEKSKHKNTMLHIAAYAIKSYTHPLEDELHKKNSYKIAEILLRI